LTNILLKRYLGSTKYVLNATNSDEIAKFDELVEIFKEYAGTYSLDYLLLMAQGYQESRLNQSVRSRAGAVGVMQVLPKTAASKPIGLKGIENDIKKNIHAGAKYLRYLMDTYLNDPAIDERNRLLLGLAAYNAGPGNLRKIRKKTTAMGLDRNVWFDNVERGAAQVIGRETVQYVSNIYKYYLAYLLVEERRRAREKRVSLAKP
jgi:membrane-bound lytic murein transglycosylase MltF